MYLEEPSCKSFFIALILYGEIVVSPTEKLVASYVIGELAFLD